MTMFSKDYMESSLRMGIRRVVFTKVNGDVREMRCTLVPEHISLDESKSKEPTRQQPEGVVTVWDLDKKAWRSFYADSVTAFDHES